MEIEHCVFPDQLLYDLENNTWLRLANKDEVTVGITSLLSSIAGRFTQAHFKNVGTSVQRGQSLGTLESAKFVGPVPCPVTGTIIATNGRISNNPKLLNDSPYEAGWVSVLRPSNLHSERQLLANAAKAEPELRKKVGQFRAKCFKAFPDHELVEIGVECAAVLVRLDELVLSIPVGEVIHVVSDDVTAYVEMVRWTDRSGQSLLDWRREDGLFHFIVKKTHGGRESKRNGG